MSVWYGDEVDHFGGSAPSLNPKTGKLIRLNQKTKFTPEEVATDGCGNITDMPLLRNKPCFGRPERHYRGITEISVWRKFGKQPVANLTTCQRCPIMTACGKVCDERLDSAPDVNAAFEVWGSYSANLVETEVFKDRQSLARWFAFLDAIKAHGGWSSVNEARVAVEDYKKVEAARKRRPGTSNLPLQKRMQSRSRTALIKPATPAFRRALAAERERRCEILKNLHAWPQSLKQTTKIDIAGCEFVADVWMVSELLIRTGRTCILRTVAEELTRRGLDQKTLNKASLINKVRRADKRIAVLEDLESGNPIWAPFDPKC